MEKQELKRLLKLPREEQQKEIANMNSGERLLLDVYIDKRLKRSDKLIGWLIALATGLFITGCLVLIFLR